MYGAPVHHTVNISRERPVALLPASPDSTKLDFLLFKLVKNLVPPDATNYDIRYKRRTTIFGKQEICVAIRTFLEAR